MELCIKYQEAPITMVFLNGQNRFQLIDTVYPLFHFKKLKKWKTYSKGYIEILKKNKKNNLNQCKRERFCLFLFIFPLIFSPKQLVQNLFNTCSITCIGTCSIFGDVGL